MYAIMFQIDIDIDNTILPKWRPRWADSLNLNDHPRLTLTAVWPRRA